MSLGFNNSPLVRHREAGARVVPASRNFYAPLIRLGWGDNDACSSVRPRS